MDPGQCGGLSQSSITHYLLKLLHFCHYNLDQHDPHAVILGMVDMSKAFNRVSHNLLVQDLYDMHVPGWLLCIIASYLSSRSMILHFHGAQSSRRSLPGGGPQGALLGGIIFIVKFNGAALRPSVPRFIFSPHFKNQLRERKSMSVKFVDDLTVAVSVKLSQETAKRPSMPLPPSYRERTGHLLIPGTEMSSQLENIAEFSNINLMRINEDKTKLMVVNTSTATDFLPSLAFGGGEPLEVIESTKLLGVILSSNLKWQENTDFICKKGMSRLWLLRRLKMKNLEWDLILDYYTKEIRPVLELAAPAWHSGLTKAQSESIERIQKTALKIIFGPLYNNYEIACSLACVEPLDSRREFLSLNFAKKTADKSRHSDLFKPILNPVNTRQESKKYQEHSWRNWRFFHSPLPYLTRLLNTGN